MKLSNQLYDVLKRIAQIYLPAAGALYAGLALVWHLPASEQVTSTVVVVDTFLGVLLGVSSSSYLASGAQFDGQVHITPQLDGPTNLHLQLDSEDPVAAMLSKGQLTLKVNPPLAPVGPSD